MGRLIAIMSMLLILSLSAHSASPYIQFNEDKKTRDQVLLNTSMQMLVETAHTLALDSATQKQKRMAVAADIYAACKYSYHRTLENVKGFERESALYKCLARTGADIVRNAGLAKAELSKSKVAGKITAGMKIGEMVVHAASLASTFVSVVTNATVQNPMEEFIDGTYQVDLTSSKDKYNLMNRYERMKMARDILYEMRRINWDLFKMRMHLRTQNAWGAIRYLDWDGYINALVAKKHVENAISSWKSLTSGF